MEEKVVNMEDNKINEGKVNNIEGQNQTIISDEQLDLNLTNEQKLEYISKLIQSVDCKFESSELNKKMIK
jgi:hypothetical protein